MKIEDWNKIIAMFQSFLKDKIDVYGKLNMYVFYILRKLALCFLCMVKKIFIR